MTGSEPPLPMDGFMAGGNDMGVNGGEKFPRIVGQKFPTSF